MFFKSGDWGLGIGDWAQSPIPNPQSPIINNNNNKKIIAIMKNDISLHIHLFIHYLFICK